MLDIGISGLLGFSALDRIGETGKVIFSDISPPLVDTCAPWRTTPVSPDGAASSSTAYPSWPVLPDASVDLVLHASGDLVVSGRDVVAVNTADPAAVARPVLTDPTATGFNDLGAGPGGELLAGVLRYRPLRGEPPTPGALRIVPTAGEPRDLPGTVLWPNGVAVGSGWLCLSDFATGTVLRGRWVPDGEDMALYPWWASPSGQADGLALDADGAVLVALGIGGGVARVLPDATVDTVLEVPASFTASVCFCGDDLDRLIVTTADNTRDPSLGGCVFELPAPVPGAPVPPITITLNTPEDP